MIVNRAETTEGKETLEDWLEDHGFKGLERHGLVHRLDKDTSGVLIVAKTKESLEALQSQFKKRQVSKTYLALLHGRLEPRNGDVNLPISRNPLNRQRFGVFVGGRSAFTAYKVLEYYELPQKREQLTLVEALPKTGRTHQLRVHFKHLNHPIVSDPWYGGRKTTKKDLHWCPRLFLHAAKISFEDPDKKIQRTVESFLAKDLQSVLVSLKKALTTTK
jgi:23S rRNA pseudouridine1911/1915/1917 synthase